MCSSTPLPLSLLSASTVQVPASFCYKNQKTPKTLTSGQIHLHVTTGNSLEAPTLFTVSPTLRRQNWLGFNLNTQQDLDLSSQTLWLVSPVGRPADTIGPFCDDRRKLGLLIGRMELWIRETCFQILPHFVQPFLPGWHNVEAPHCRWTKGQALLPLTQPTHEGHSLLAIEILACGF